MFKKNTMITRSIYNELDSDITMVLWTLVQSPQNRELDYLQIFNLENVGTKEESVLKITWKQECPEHIETHYVKGLYTKVSRVWIICEGEATDEEYSTMLLPEDY